VLDGEVLDHRSQSEVVVDVVVGDEDSVDGLAKVRPASEEFVQVGDQPRSRRRILRPGVDQHRPARELEQHTLALPDVHEMGGHRGRLRPTRHAEAQNDSDCDKPSSHWTSGLIAT